MNILKKLLGDAPAFTKGTLGRVASVDPLLALAFAGGPSGLRYLQEFGSCSGCGEEQWQVINVCACFQSGALEVVTSETCKLPAADLFIYDAVYSVSRPNAFPGSIFKAQSDHFNELNPNIDASITIKSYCDYIIAPEPTPIQNLLRARSAGGDSTFDCACPFGLILHCNADIFVEFENKRIFASDEVPIEVCISLHGVRLPVKYNACGLGIDAKTYAMKQLLAAGVAMPPNVNANVVVEAP